MPKMKTNRGATKRLKRRGDGTLKRRRAFRNHILTKKATKRKRQLRGLTPVVAADANSAARMLCDK